MPRSPKLFLHKPSANGSVGQCYAVFDRWLLGEWVCTAAGTPGTWMQIRPAPVTSDPTSGTIPTGYLIWNVTTGHIKRHAGGYVWNVPPV